MKALIEAMSNPPALRLLDRLWQPPRWPGNVKPMLEYVSLQHPSDG